jgi:vitamin-K-epoxide reductase (warfarin-sensitive)
MKYILIFLAVVGVAVSSLALHEHYRTDTSPCSINERWDCGIVNHSPFAMLFGVPVAAIGIAGYAVLGVLAAKRSFRTMMLFVLPGLAFSLYLAHVEKDILGVWCIYCVASLATISLMVLFLVWAAIRSGRRRNISH